MAQLFPTGLRWWRVLAVALSTALAYAAVAAIALFLAGPPAYASPLFPSAGIALAATLVYGRTALPGVWLGAWLTNAALGPARSVELWPALVLPAAIGLGAMAQAGVGAWLVRRFVPQPVVLEVPRDILLAAMLGAVLACTLSASVATVALSVVGVVPAGDGPSTWLTWWQGDTLGVLIGAPLVLTLIGQPGEDWRPRRRTLGLPMLLVLMVLAATLSQLARSDRQRALATFERDADRLAGNAQLRIGSALHALQALHSAARQPGELNPSTLREASRWWLAQPLHLQAMGHSVRLSEAEVPPFEAEARRQGLASYRVFDRDEGVARRSDGEVVALRHIEPAAGNTAALGVNVLSIPAARMAIEATRRSGEPAASAGFRLTQAQGNETGVVLYQALYRGEPGDAAARHRAFRGLVFVTVNTGKALASLSQAGQEYLRWCLVDMAPASGRMRLAGPAGCEGASPARADLAATRHVHVGGREWQLQISASPSQVPGHAGTANWLLASVGLAATALLGALLLTVTGQHRRTQLAVTSATADLRREMAERQSAEQAARESEARLRSILDHAPLGVVFLDVRGEILEANQCLCEMVGRNAEALRGRLVTELVHPDDVDKLLELRRELLHDQLIAGRGPLRLATGTAPQRQVRVSASALRDERERAARMVVVVEDVTEHLRLEASERALQRAEEANRAKNEFLSRMSHELRTPLNAMIGFTQLLQLDTHPALPAHQQAWTQQVLRAGWHLLEMINETLDLARIETGAVRLTLQPVDLPAMVAGTHALLASAAADRGVKIEEALDPQALAVQADATRLKQVLTNLLSNAIKYNQTGGRVGLGTRRVEGGGWIEIEVADSGLGMTDTQLGNLFQPYNRLGRETSGIEGTGIGLVISRRLTELMGGTLTVQSRQGAGSVFTVRLPEAIATQADASPPALAAQPQYRHRLVHYVEDNETNVEVMRGVLAQRPQITLLSSTLGLDGLVAIRQQPPDLILLDMQLPDISGAELLRHLQQDPVLASIAVVVVSADATPARIEEALSQGARHYVTKPLDVPHFLTIIDKLLEDTRTRF
ncbi:MAG TPA: CHASE domain-containing protein [Rubrivivax sp.]|nr:CHASE domain-containing protein [Rubrivivax sp.]